MDQEQLDLIIRAAQVLQERKEFYDYAIVVLPVFTAFVGWFASIWWQTRTFTRNTKKEHYYAAREKVEAIIVLFHEFLQYVYSFQKMAKNNANHRHLGVDHDAFCDFVTRYQFQLGFIHQRLKITFPGRRFPIEKVTSQTKGLEENITTMNHILVDLCKPDVDVDAINRRVTDLNRGNSEIIANITNEVARIENAAVELLNKRAKELGIKEL